MGDFTQVDGQWAYLAGEPAQIDSGRQCAIMAMWLDPTFLNGLVNADVIVKVTYYDGDAPSNGPAFGIGYQADTGGPSAATVALTGSGMWRTAEFDIPAGQLFNQYAPLFSGHWAGMRLSLDIAQPTYIHSITITKG